MAGKVPEFLHAMLTAQYGGELADRIEDGYTKRRPVTLRANTLKSGIGQVKEQLGAAGIRWRTVSWSAEALILDDGTREPAVRELEIYKNGEIYLQSLSSMIPPILMEPRPGECILDMAAAPGGKTTQLAALSGGEAQITACEKNYARAERLRYNLEKQGAARVLVMNEDARKLDSFFSFDKILLDAPCSGSGTLYVPEESGGGRMPAITRELIDRSARTQEALLKKALQILKPGCEMVYSTCSVLEIENERALRRALSGVKVEIVPIRHPMVDELPLLPSSVEGTVCICPTELYEGFFVAKIKKR